MRVKDLNESCKFYEQIGYKVVQRFEREDLHAHAAHLEYSNNTIELWQFDSHHPQHEYIAKHIALESDCLEEDLEVFKRNGFAEVIPLTQGKTLRYAFVRDASGNCIEIGQR